MFSPTRQLHRYQNVAVSDDDCVEMTELGGARAPSPSTDAITPQPLHPCMWAISFEQLLEIEVLAKRTFGHWNYRSKTMRHVNDSIVIPRCEASGTCLALSLNPQGLPTDAFITHCWDEHFADFVDSIRHAFHPFTTKPNLWICAFALRQGDERIVEEQLGMPLEESPFVQALSKAEWFVVVRNSQTDLYSRIWCVCELMYAKKYGFTMTNKTMVIGPDKFSSLKTSCLHAEAFDPKDRQRILQVLIEELDGVDEIDRLVQQYRTHAVHAQANFRRGNIFGRSVLAILVAGILVLLSLLSLGMTSNTNQPKTDTNQPTTNTNQPKTNTNQPKTNTNQTVPDLNDVSYLPSYTIETIKQNYESPQSRALVWTQNNARYSWYEPSMKLLKQQLFAVAVISFSIFGYPPTQDKCEFSILKCDNSSLVQEIHLSMGMPWDMKLDDGRILPPEISLLSSLRYLSVEVDFAGPLPTQLGLLGKLKTLKIKGSGGFLPSQVIATGDFPQLYSYGGTIPSELGQLASLTSLEIQNSTLTGTICTELGMLASLTTLVLARNWLSGSLPSHLGMLPSVTHLDLSGLSTYLHKPFSGQIPTEIGLMTSLTYLKAESNVFTGHLPTQLWSLTKLTHLNLGLSGYFSGTLPTQVGLLTSLKKLYLSSSSFFEWYVALHLKYYGTIKPNSTVEVPPRLSGSLPSELARLTDLEVMDLSYNYLTGTIPTELGQLSSLEKLSIVGETLRILYMEDMAMQARWLLRDASLNITSHLQHVMRHKRRDERRDLTGTIPTQLGLLSKMTSLNLAGNQISGPFPAELNRSSLRHLDLGINMLSAMAAMTYYSHREGGEHEEYRAEVCIAIPSLSWLSPSPYHH